MRPFWLSVILVTLLLLLAVLSVDALDTIPWVTSTPEAQGIDSGKLADLLESTQSGFTFDSILVIRHGNVVLDVSTFPFNTSQPHAIYSVTKSFVSTLSYVHPDRQRPELGSVRA